MRTLATIALATLLTGSAAAEAPIDDGTSLVNNCRRSQPATTQQAANYQYCIAYIRGVMQRGSLDRMYYCFPPGDKDDSAAKAVVDYLERDPAAEYHYPAVLLVLNALNKSFACPKT